MQPFHPSHPPTLKATQSKETEGSTSTAPAVSPSVAARDTERPDQGFKIPPRKSSLSLRERRAISNRKTSSASFAGAPSPPLFEVAKTKALDTKDSAVVHDEEETTVEDGMSGKDAPVVDSGSSAYEGYEEREEKLAASSPVIEDK